MKIHIITAGYGKGHDQAALLLKEAAEHRYDNAVIWKPLEEQIPASFNVSKIMYKQLLKSFPNTWRKLALGNTDSVQPVIQMIIRKLQGPFQDILNADFILSVHPLLTYIAGEIKARTRSTVPIYHIATDYWTPPITGHPAVNGWFVSKIDKPSFIQPGQFLCPAGIPACSEGSHISRKEILLKQGWNSKKPLILISGGGEGMFPYKKVVNDVKNISIPSTIVLIGNTALRKMKTPIHGHDIEVRGYTPEFREYLQAADLLISKAGGMTLAEAALAGIPLIIYSPLPGQEEQNTMRFVEKQAAYWCHSRKEIKHKVEELLSDPFKQERWKRRMRSVKQDNSADTIVSISKTFSWEEKRKEF